MKDLQITEIIQLRAIVALLGEERGWWKTSFYGKSSSTFLQYVFPRMKNANIVSSTDLIRGVIDGCVGANKYHLFRLEVNQEERIHNSLMTKEVEIPGNDQAIQVLETISEGILVTRSTGPKYIGAIQDLQTEGTIQVLAAEYLSAFRNNYQVHPYLN